MSVCIRYSEAFKMQVVRELESGRHGSCNAVAEAYGIRGASTVQNWIRHYGKAHSLGKVVRVETTEERDQLKLLKIRIRDLESALSDAHIDLRLEQEYLRISCQRSGDGDVESFKKKHAGTPSMRLSTGART
jgi:transposase